jgi:hypothetical protein
VESGSGDPLADLGGRTDRLARSGPEALTVVVGTTLAFSSTRHINRAEC